MKKTIIYLIMSAACLSGPAQTALSLEQCRQLARENNSALKVARSNVEAANQQKKEAFTNYFPQISAVGMAFNANRDLVEMNTADILANFPAEMMSQLPPGMIPPSIGMVKNGMIGAVTAIQPVFAGGQIVNGNKLARIGLETGTLQLENSQNEVDLATEQYFWQVVSLNEKLRTLDAVDAMLARLEKDVTVSVNAGVAMRNDLLQVQLQVNDVASSRIKLENALTLCRRLLAQHIGMYGQDITALADTVGMPDFPLSLRLDHPTAVAATADYRLMQKGVEANQLKYKMEVGKNLPSVGVGASYAYNNLLGSSANRGLVFVSVSVPVSDWWGGSHAIKRQKINTEIAREQLASNSQLLVINMDNAWNSLEDSYRQLQIARLSIDQANENLRLNNDYYRVGTVTMNDLLDAQHQYQAARDRFTDAYIDFRLCILKYRQATGQS